MLAKYGFVLLIVLFGLFAFVGGMMAPASWSQTVENLGERLSGTAPKLVAAAHNDSTIAGAKQPAAADSSPTPASSAAPPPRLSDLLVKATVEMPVPAKGQPAYALQLGQFVTEDEAIVAERQWQSAADGLNLPLTTLSVVDSDRQPWTLLAIGQFTSPAAAQQMAARVQLTLKIQSTPVIQIPPSTKSAS
ncbi:MAG TPA: SPOR domain-containing protein [Dyella sp.]|nr:SPOR domain-containing protein [Dyella sp.]